MMLDHPGTLVPPYPRQLEHRHARGWSPGRLARALRPRGAIFRAQPPRCRPHAPQACPTREAGSPRRADHQSAFRRRQSRDLQPSPEARNRRIEPVMLSPGDDLWELAKQAVERGADVIGMAGRGRIRRRWSRPSRWSTMLPTSACCGTRNHFALDLGLDRSNVVGALDAFTDGVERRIDLALVNERVFVNNASLGVYARVVQSDAYRDAKLGTWKRMLPEMLEPGCCRHRPQVRRAARQGLGRRVSRDRLEQPLPAPAPPRGRHAPASRQRTPRHLCDEDPRGRSRREAGDPWHGRSAPTVPRRARVVVDLVEVRANEPVAVGLDGEALLLSPPLVFVSLPGALRVRVPRRAGGVSPAGGAVTLTRRNVWALLRIAAGKPTEVSYPNVRTEQKGGPSRLSDADLVRDAVANSRQTAGRGET